MKPLARFGMLLALMTLAASCSQDAEVTETNPPAMLEVLDGRALISVQRPTDGDLPPALQQSADAARDYWRQHNDAFEDDYRVLDIAEGAFTAPASSQQAVLFVLSLVPRCCTNMGLAVIEGDTVISTVVFEGAMQALTRVPDLDGDGLDELVMSGSFGMGGSVESSFSLLSFHSGTLVSNGSGLLGTDNCASLRPDSSSSAIRVLVIPSQTTGQEPEFFGEEYVSACENTDWQLQGEAQALNLKPSGERPFTALENL